jgi:hypothetical protein
MDSALGINGEPQSSSTGEPLHQQPSAPPPSNPEDVERVKGKWGEDLNTAFAYEKYNAPPASGGAWAATATRYEWHDDYEADAIAPRDERLEKELFGADDEGNMGINFNK